MDKVIRKVDSYLMGLTLELFIVSLLFIFYRENNNQMLNFIMLCITFFTVMITYTGGAIVGLILTSIAIFIYASYIFYINLSLNVEIGYISYLWMIFIPIISFTTSKLSEYISLLQETNLKLKKEYENLVTIDEKTGLQNIKSFYFDLDKEMSRAKRYDTSLTLMLIKLPYYKDIKKILGETKTKKLMKDISDVITKYTRNEDERYTIEEDTLAIIMSNTDLVGAQVVKERIKQGITELNLALRDNKDYIDIDNKVSILEYKQDIKTPLEFKVLAQEELQYDV